MPAIIYKFKLYWAAAAGFIPISIANYRPHKLKLVFCSNLLFSRKTLISKAGRAEKGKARQAT